MATPDFPDSCRFLRRLMCLGLLTACVAVHAFHPEAPHDQAASPPYPGPLPKALDEDQATDAEGLSAMSERALQAALRARRAYFKDSGWDFQPRNDLKSPEVEGLADPGLAADLRRSGLTRTGGTNDEPTGEITLPVDPDQSCPGFYVLRTHSGASSVSGRFGVELLLRGQGSRTLQGGLNFGGRATHEVGGFAAFNIANRHSEDQVVNIGLDAASAGRLVLERRAGGTTTVIVDQAVSTGETAVSATVTPGFYVVSYRPNSTSDVRYSISALTSYADRSGGGFQGGVVFGGFHDPERSASGFGGFCIAEPYAVEVKVLSQPSYGSSGARGMAFSLASGDGLVYLDSRLQSFQDCPECPTMMEIPGGTFIQGSTDSEPQHGANERPHRQVDVTGFGLGRTAVTFEQWDACVADGACSHVPDDEGWGRGSRPVINVSWNDAQEYVAWLRVKTGRNYRLPSESEWEYAARAGTQDRFNTGDCIDTRLANFQGGAPAAGCPGGEFRGQTLPVASFAPNSWGLHDMHGNVWEWVADCWNWGYWGAPPTDGSAWLTGSCQESPLRGGSWAMGGRAIRSASRGYDQKSVRNRFRGFRVAVDTDEAAPNRTFAHEAISSPSPESQRVADDMPEPGDRIIGPGVVLDERGDVIVETLPSDAVTGVSDAELQAQRYFSTMAGPSASTTVLTGRFVSSSGRALDYRLALPQHIDLTEPKPVLIYFHGNNRASKQQILDSFFPGVAWRGEQRELIPITVSSPETRNPPQEETRQWMSEDQPLLDEFLQFGLSPYFTPDHHQIYFAGGSQGTCFLHDFMQSHGENYGGGFYGGCGCYNSPDPTWDPANEFLQRMRVYINTTSGDFLYEHGHRGYAFYKYTIGLNTRGDLEQEGPHCSLHWQQMDIALDWFTGALEIPEPAFSPHWQRISPASGVEGLTIDGTGAVWMAINDAENERAKIWRQAAADPDWELVNQLDGVPRDLVSDGETLFLTLNRELLRSSDRAQSFFSVDPAAGQTNRIVMGGDNFLHRATGNFNPGWGAWDRNGELFFSTDAGQSWESYGTNIELASRDSVSHINDSRAIAIDQSRRWYSASPARATLYQWAPIPEHLTQVVGASWDGRSIWAMAIDSAQTAHILRSTDEGGTWQEIPLPEPIDNLFWGSGSGHTLTALEPGVVLMRGGAHSAWITFDEGESWQRKPGLETAFDGSPRPRGFVAARSGEVVYTDGSAVFRLRLEE